MPLTAAFVAWSCRFENVAEPEPSAFTVTNNVLDVGVKATNCWPPAARLALFAAEPIYVPGPVYVRTSQVIRNEESGLLGKYHSLELAAVPGMPACANAAHAGLPAMLSVKLADLVTAPVTERVAANAWVPPETAPVVAPAAWLEEPAMLAVSVAVLEEPQAAIRSATLASATIPATL